MGRKVNLVGKETLTVSLPRRWVKENNIKKGDELTVSLDNKDITFSCSRKKDKIKSITINIDDFTYLALSRYISVLYKTNYNRIVLIYSKLKIDDPKKDEYLNLRKTITKIVNHFIGVEIVSQSSTKTEIECFVTEESPDLNKIEKRILFLLKETTNELLEAIGPKYYKFHETIYDHHDNVVKFINYFLRSLYDSDLGEDEKKLAFVFYSVIDQIVDKLRHLSEKINEYGCTPTVKRYLEEIFEIFYEEFNLLNKRQLSQELIKKRYALKRKINKEKFSIKEFKVLVEVNILLDTMNEFTEYLIAKKLAIQNDKSAYF